MADLLTRRQVEVAHAAAEVFLAQGYARTTMGDLAGAARLTRQGLYLIFPNKEAAFAAAVQVLDDRLHAEIEEGLARRRGLSARLSFVCERWIGGVYDLQQTTPAAKDMDNLEIPIVRAVYERFVRRVAQLITEHGPLPPDLDATELGRVLVYAIRGFTMVARDSTDMRRLVRLQIRLVVEAIERARAANADARLSPAI